MSPDACRSCGSCWCSCLVLSPEPGSLVLAPFRAYLPDDGPRRGAWGLLPLVPARVLAVRGGRVQVEAGGVRRWVGAASLRELENAP